MNCHVAVIEVPEACPKCGSFEALCFSKGQTWIVREIRCKQCGHVPLKGE